MKKLLRHYNILWAILGLFLAPVCHAQTTPMPITQVDSCMVQEAKPILILLATDWCKYCQMQKSHLLKNKDFQTKVDLFYYVEFDAESKGKVRFHGQDYVFKATNTSSGVHELALALNGPGQLSFPTWILLDKEYQVLFRYQGVLSSRQLEKLLEAIEEVKE